MFTSLFFFAFAALVLADDQQAQTIFQIVDTDAAFATLKTKVDTATATLLGGTTAYTLLAPNNAAWVGAPTTVSLPLHVIPGNIPSSALTDEQFVGNSLNTNSFLRVFINAGSPATVRFCSQNCARVVRANVAASNGVVHEIDVALIPAANNTIAQIVSATGSNFQTLLALLNLAELTSAVATDSAKLTVFAPTDAVFSSTFNAKQVACLRHPDRRTDLGNILKYHVVSGDIVPSFQITNGAQLTSLFGTSSSLVASVGTGVSVNGANVVTADVFARNGVVHVIDKVLLPPQYNSQWLTNQCRSIVDLVSASPNLASLTSRVVAAGLAPTLDDLTKTFTVFAPVNAAFNSNSAPNLLFHVLSGKVRSSSLSNNQLIPASYTEGSANVPSFLRVLFNAAKKRDGQQTEVYVCSGNCAKVTSVDNEGLNGIVHEISNVLVPTRNQTITDIVSASSSTFSSLILALTQTGLISLVSDPTGSLTVFAPNDEAFLNGLGPEQIACLVDGDHNDDLADIVKNHVLPYVLPAELIEDGASYATALEGQSLSAVIVNNRVMIGGADVTSTNTFAVNGVVHTIDRILIPPKYTNEWFEETCPELFSASSTIEIFLGFISFLFLFAVLF